MERHVRVIVKGEVQGVGYRYTVLDIARNFEVRGFVRNLSDGNVEVQAEGEEEELKRFLRAIEIKQGGIYVSALQTEWKEAGKKFSGFDVLRTESV